MKARIFIHIMMNKVWLVFGPYFPSAVVRRCYHTNEAAIIGCQHRCAKTIDPGAGVRLRHSTRRAPGSLPPLVNSILLALLACRYFEQETEPRPLIMEKGGLSSCDPALYRVQKMSIFPRSTKKASREPARSLNFFCLIFGPPPLIDSR